MLTIKIYHSSDRDIWNSFVEKSKNGLFLFNRNYLEYHSDRFFDISLLFYESDKLIAVMPANRVDTVMYSHAGLTFGGIISNSKMTAIKMLEVFEALRNFLIDQKFTKLIYKAIPFTLHNIAAQEDLYALSVFGGRIVRRDLSSVIYMEPRLPFSKSKKCGISKAVKAGLIVRQTDDLCTFMQILEKAIQKHGAAPTHTLEEMVLLSKLFTDKIKLFAAYEGNTMLAGVLIYEYGNVAHTQYMASGSKGRETGAIDIIIKVLLEDVYSGFKYFSFGTSTEHAGLYLNQGLVSQKEMFGARTIVQDFYEVHVESFNNTIIPDSEML